MPIYEYVCRTCGEETEKLQKLSDAPLTDCPACGEASLKRKISAAGFRLAGSGWYETDFKDKGKRNLAGDGAASKQESGASEKSSGKSDGDKPATKSSGSDSKAKSKPKSGSASDSANA